MANEKDKIAFADQQAVAKACESLMDRVQMLPRNTHLLALGTTFRVFCARKGLDPREVLDAADRMIYDADHTMREEFNVARDVTDNDL